MIFKINNSCFLSFIFLSLLFSVPLLASPLIKYTANGDTILKPLNNLSGDPEKGRQIVRDRNKGNCLACHQLPIPEEPFHGTIGPKLSTVALRLNEAQLRFRVVDMKQLNPFSIMPGFYRNPQKIIQISPLYENTTILTAQEVEDVVSYLITLKSEEVETF